MASPQERGIRLARELTILSAFGTWLGIAGIIAWLDGGESSSRDLDVSLWVGAIGFGHLLSLPGLMLAAVRLAGHTLRRAPRRGAVIAVIHFLLGLALLIPTLAIGGWLAALVVGAIYLFTSGWWTRHAKRVFASEFR